jgi:ribonuclease R
VRGTISVHSRGFGFVVPIASTSDDEAASSSAFVTPPELNKFLADDVVDCRVEVSGDKRTARDLALVSRPRTRLFGVAVRRAGALWLKIDRLVANTDWPLDDADPALKDGAKVLARVDGNRAKCERTLDGVDAEIEALLARHDLAGEHSAAVVSEAEAKARVASAPKLDGKRDLRGVVCVTIDGPSTEDIDDALLAFPPDAEGALRVVVAIADVSSVVDEGSLLDRDAKSRTTSVYLAGRTLPMLPRCLSEESLSLVEGKERSALCVEMRIDVEGRVLAVDVDEAVIKSTARLTYGDVARFLDDADARAVPSTTHETLRLLRAASARLSQARSERGGKDVEREEISVRLDERGEPTGLDVRTSDVAHVMVERLMVAANEAVARFLVERGLPGVFRVHDSPTAERTLALAEAANALGIVAGFSTSTALSPKALAAFDRQFRGTRDERAFESLLRRLLGPARYQTAAALHFGLAAPLYLHFTSPIRRYADLAVHRVLRRFLRGERNFTRADVDALDALCLALNDKGRRAARAESERDRALLARLLAQKIGETRRGVVVGNKPQGALVQVDGALALLSGGQRPLGEALDVVIEAVDEELGRVDVRLP